ncbi:hypothetical protein F5B18DRAFT_66011 [Nemania serpens]|nr:hypothetical protein F5B18DRAFT_66011 [Nemania serpens]
MTDTNTCAAPASTSTSTSTQMPETPNMLIAWQFTHDEPASSAFPHPHASKSSPSPSFSAESSESYPLSRSSSISTCDWSDDDSDDERGGKIILVSILKKPRQRDDINVRQRQHNQRPSSNDSSGQDVAHEDDACDGEEDWDRECEDDDEDEDDDDESECEIIFERNVSFNDPLATDIVTGDPVKPSPLSRLEWTALKARECLERERHEFGKDREAFDEAWLEFEDARFGSRKPEEEEHVHKSATV